MINVTVINLVPVVKEVCTGHSLVPPQMTILMSVKQISSTTFTMPLSEDSSNIEYDRLSAETTHSDGDRHCSYSGYFSGVAITNYVAVTFTVEIFQQEVLE